MADDNNSSVIILYSFVFLFMVFLLLQNTNFIDKPTGYATSDNLISNSLITVIATVFVLGVGGFFIYKKIRKKKETNLEIPKPPIPAEKSIETLNKDFNIPPSPNQNFNNDINQLFTEIPPEPENTTPAQEKEIPQEMPKIEDETLKKLLKLLINKKYSKDNILKYLNSKGYNIMQIKNAIDSINEENINNYVELASSQGFNKQEIVSSLLKAGWKKEDILKCI